MWSVIASFFSGGVVGLVGSIFKQVMAYKQKQLEAEERAKDRQFELDKMDKDREMMKAETEANVRIIETETEGNMAIEGIRADVAGRAMAYEQDKATYSSGAMRKESKMMLFVDFCRGMARPAITCYLIFLITALIGIVSWGIWELRTSIEMVLALKTNTAHGLALATLLVDIANGLVLLVCNLASVAVSYWFGDRNSTGQALVKKMAGIPQGKYV